MTAEELGRRMHRYPVYDECYEMARLRLVFVFNLIAGQEFTEARMCDARDALASAADRAYITRLLRLPSSENTKQPVSTWDQDAPTTAFLVLDDNQRLKRRLLAFLRPSPSMMVEIEKKEIDTEPPLAVFQVTIEDGRGGSWCEAFPSEETLQAFLRGINVTFAMSDLQMMVPRIPLEALQFKEQACVVSLTGT